MNKSKHEEDLGMDLKLPSDEVGLRSRLLESLKAPTIEARTIEAILKRLSSVSSEYFPRRRWEWSDPHCLLDCALNEWRHGTPMLEVVEYLVREFTKPVEFVDKQGEIQIRQPDGHGPPEVLRYLSRQEPEMLKKAALDPAEESEERTDLEAILGLLAKTWPESTKLAMDEKDLDVPNSERKLENALVETLRTEPHNLRRVRAIAKRVLWRSHTNTHTGDVPALEVALENGAPLEVVQFLVETDLTFVGHYDDEGMWNLTQPAWECGRLTRGGAPLEVVKYMAERWPIEAVDDEGISGIIRFFVETWPESVEVASLLATNPYEEGEEEDILEQEDDDDHLDWADVFDLTVYLDELQASNVRQNLRKIWAILRRAPELTWEDPGGCGYLPLYCALENDCSPLLLIKLLFGLNPDVLGYSTECCGNPLQLALAGCRDPLETLEIVQWMVEARPDVVEPGVDEYGDPILDCSCLGAPLEVLRYLVDKFPKLVKGAVLNGEDNMVHGNTRLHEACGSNSNVPLETIQFLVEVWPDALETANANRKTPLDLASSLAPSPHQEAVVQYLVETAARRHNTLPFHYACANRVPLELIKKLLSRQWRGFTRAVDESGATPLHSACTGQAELDVVQFLLEQWPESIRAVDKSGATPLHSACAGQAGLGVVQFLLEQRPESIRAVDKDKKIPFHTASYNDAPQDVILFLLKMWPESVYQEHE